MPSWGIHLLIAKKVNTKLHYNSNTFYYANLLPDVNKKYNITRKETHYYNDKIICEGCPKETLPDINSFIEDYKEHLDSELIVGYYCHLLADYYYNNIIAPKCYLQDKDNNIIGLIYKDGKKKIYNEKKLGKILANKKHHDLELYAKYLFKENKVDVPIEDDEIYKDLNLLKNQFVLPENAKERIEYLSNDFNKFNKIKFFERIGGLKLFYKEELDKVLDDCVSFIIEKLKEENIIKEVENINE